MSNRRTPLSNLFLSVGSPEIGLPQAEALERHLDELLASAREAWPRVSLAAEVFVTYLAEKILEMPEPSVVETLDELAVSDLYLACACGEGDPTAIACFEETYLSAIGPAIEGLRLPAVSVDDVKQDLREKILLGKQGKPPKILQYSGRAGLKAWLEVAAVREALGVQRREKRVIPVDTARVFDRLMEQMTPEEGPEVAHFKRAYRDEFQAAFRDAMASLTTRERNALRYRYLDELNIDQIGAIYGVHRATVARWIAKARQDLLGQTRQRLMQRLKLHPTSIDSVICLLNTLEMSIPWLSRDSQKTFR